MAIKEGKEYRVRLPFLGTIKNVRVEYILPSKSYEDETFVVYRYFERNRWNTNMVQIECFESWIKNGKNILGYTKFRRK